MMMKKLGLLTKTKKHGGKRSEEEELHATNKMLKALRKGLDAQSDGEEGDDEADGPADVGADVPTDVPADVPADEPADEPAVRGTKSENSLATMSG
jgi:hypothetical protein